MWCALVRSWNRKREMYDSLTLRIEDTEEPGCAIKLYDGETAVAEALADSPQAAIAEALQLARNYLNDASIMESDLAWVQM